MSHGDSVVSAPEGFTVTAASERAPVAAFEDRGRRLAGVQYHPEVGHSPHGQQVLRRFLHDVAGVAPGWTIASIIDETVAAIREQVGDGRAICGLSGGVDSAVAAALVQRAIGDRLTCVFVDHGLLRAGEREQVEKDFVAATGRELHTVDAARALPERARRGDRPRDQAQDDRPGVHPGVRGGHRAVGRASRASTSASSSRGRSTRTSSSPAAAPGPPTIKSHHNVGGLPDDIEFALVEPLRALFKDEVRKVGAELGLPDEIVHRQPFPGPGLGDPDHRRGHRGAARRPCAPPTRSPARS